MFRKIYARKLAYGDRLSIAYQLRKSEEFISKLTRYGGDACPMDKAWKWLCAIHAVNPSAAVALLDHLNDSMGELRSHTSGEWHPTKTAGELIRQAAETVSLLIDSDLSNDEQALSDLRVLVDQAIDRCRAKRPSKLKEVSR